MLIRRWFVADFTGLAFLSDIFDFILQLFVICPFTSCFRSLSTERCAKDQCNVYAISEFLFKTMTLRFIWSWLPVSMMLLMSNFGSVIGRQFGPFDVMLSLIWCPLRAMVLWLKFRTICAFFMVAVEKRNIWVNHVYFDFYFAGTNCHWNSGCLNWRQLSAITKSKWLSTCVAGDFGLLFWWMAFIKVFIKPEFTTYWACILELQSTRFHIVATVKQYCCYFVKQVHEQS